MRPLTQKAFNELKASMHERYNQLVDATARYRDTKVKILSLVEKSNQTNYTKDKLKEELFKLYMEMK